MKVLLVGPGHDDFLVDGLIHGLRGELGDARAHGAGAADADDGDLHRRHASGASGVPCRAWRAC